MKIFYRRTYEKDIYFSDDTGDGLRVNGPCPCPVAGENRGTRGWRINRLSGRTIFCFFHQQLPPQMAIMRTQKLMRQPGFLEITSPPGMWVQVLAHKFMMNLPSPRTPRGHSGWHYGLYECLRLSLLSTCMVVLSLCRCLCHPIPFGRSPSLRYIRCRVPSAVCENMGWHTSLI